MKKTSLIIATLLAILSFTTFVSSAYADCGCPAGGRACDAEQPAPETEEPNQ